MKYNSTMRPVAPGSYPAKDKVVSITNFDDKQFCEDIDGEAWGYIEYSEELTKEEADAYELIKGGLKPYWSVMEVLTHRTGRVVAKVKDKITAPRQPENETKVSQSKTVMLLWFNNEEDAKKEVEGVMF